MRVGYERFVREIIWVEYDDNDISLCSGGCEHGSGKDTFCRLFSEVRESDEKGRLKRVTLCRLQFGFCQRCRVARFKATNTNYIQEEHGDDLEFYVDGKFRFAVHKAEIVECKCKPWKCNPDDITIEQMRRMMRTGHHYSGIYNTNMI